ncbi:MAG: maleylpyruvate isomerase family mycothiol-dependent enzyme [Jatrophihabitantaceae bacterium]
MSSLHPAAAGLDYFADIAKHSAALAEAAESNLSAQIEHCPGWTVADLVAHVWQVHWFWTTIAEQKLTERPDGLVRPPRPSDQDLIAEFRAGALAMIEVLRAADPDTTVWTWAPSQRNIGFISRHQVQEAAVHRWDAEHAAGRACSLDVAGSVDSIEEFLTVSVSSVTDQPDEPRPDLAGMLVLVASDADAAWTISDAELPGTVRFERGAAAGRPSIRASPSDLLLWLYRRVALPVDPGAGTAGSPAGAAQSAEQLVERFRHLCFTD